MFSFYGCDDENNLLSEENGKPETIDSIPAVDSVQISIVFNCDSLSLHVGESDTIIAIVKNGDVIVDCNVLWSTDSAQVVAVDTNGIVTALSVGTAVITAKYQDVNATCKVTVSEQPIMYEYVDLGLSVMWATFNVGATKPEEYGDYFAWGETETYYEDGYAQEDPQKHWKDDKTDGYVWASYKWGNEDNKNLNKYNTNNGYGMVDNKITLDLEDDVVHEKWGGEWRMPTKTEQNELFDHCTWVWIKENDVTGYRVTSKIPGFTDKSIFLPAAGSRDLNLNGAGYCGQYWSSSLSDYSPFYASFIVFDEHFICSDRYNRSGGRSVRPVCPSKEWLSHISLSLNKDSLILFPLKPHHSTEKLDVSFRLDGEEYTFTDELTWESDDSTIVMVDENGNVQAISNGTAHIRVTWRSISVQCKVIVTDDESKISHEYVDLGLSVKWATLNVGALKPEEYGDYYAWGEVETKTEFTWENYIFRKSGESNDDIRFTKYNYDREFGDVDNKSILDLEDDVAHVKWGGSWRMPTKQEQDELRTDCTWTKTTLNGINGYLVTSKKSGYTDRSIFLPAAGSIVGTDKITETYNSAPVGFYWSSSLGIEMRPFCAWYGSFGSAEGVSGRAWCRYYGQTVRPVCP